MTVPRAYGDPMSTDRWQRVQDLFAAALECDGTARARLLGDECRDDPELLLEVESLIAAHERPGLLDRLAPAIAAGAAWARAQVAGWEGRRVGHYAIVELVDAGGMGIVYKAHDDRLGRDVALKFLPPHLSRQAASKDRFLVEARAAAALDHPNICTIFEIGETDEGQLFLAMPLYDGETLRARLKRGRLPFDAAVPIAVQIARGVGAAHARGIVHRDIKPSNVMLLRDGAVKIVDFGIATMEDLTEEDRATAERVDAGFGTLAYMSPEHVRGGGVDFRADIWSVGILLHEMLTGARPFAGRGEALADSIVNRDPDLIATSYPDVPAGVEVILRRALQKRPEDRYASMAAFAADLTTVAMGGASVDEIQSPAITERRRAAVLVTIVSNYGSLVERMTPTAAQRLVAEARDMAVDAVRRHGGIVNQAIGEEIVSVFGVPLAHDDDELRAVRAALDLHQRVAERAANGGSLPAIQIRSGLHAGTVVAQRLNEGPRRYAIVGPPATVASRLASLAPPGDVVISPECQRLLSPFVHTAACFAIAFEPDAAPVTPFRVIAQTGLETRLEASERSGLTPYVGRDADLARVERYVDAARRGEGRVIEIVGEPGVGKSRLLHELRKRLAASPAGAGENVFVLHGRCRAFGDVAPYCPFIEVVRGALLLSDESSPVERLRAIDPALETFVPLFLHLLSVASEAHPLPRHLQGEHLQAALVDALAALFAALAKQAALVVLLEDWHWADSASRAVLVRMREIVASERLLFIVTTRPENAAAADGAPARTMLHLEPLDLAASTAIVAAGLEADRVSEQLVRHLFERTGGNPFFLEQVCRALVEQAVVSFRDGEAIVDGGPETLSLPDTVQAVIRTRLDNLEARPREVVRVASVFGREFEHALLAEVLGSEIDVASAIARLVDSGLICRSAEGPRPGYRFTHVLTQEVSYESLLGHQRKLLHEAIGRAIEKHDPDRVDEQAAFLAHHFSRAEAWREAVRYGARAADRATAFSQFADAFEALEQVLQWLPQLPDDDESRQLRTDVLFKQERACETMGMRRRQQEIIGRLVAHLAPAGTSAGLAEAYLREGDLLTLLKRFSAADRALSTALRISRELNDTRLERNILRSIGLLRWHEGRHAEALTLTENALAIDRACHDEEAVAGDLVNLTNILRSMGKYEAGIAYVDEALAMPSLAQNPKKLAYALHTLANVYRGMGNIDATLAILRRADESAAHLLPIQRSFHLTSIAHIELQQGHVEVAIRTYERAIEMSRRARHAEGLAQSLCTLGEVLFELRRDRQSLPYLVEAAELCAQLEDAAAEADMWTHAATARERIDQHADALGAWKRVQALCRRSGDVRGQLAALEGIARAIRHIEGATDASVSAFAAALDFAATLGESGRALACRNTLGILEWARGRHADALGHYEAALLLVRDQNDPVQEGVVLNSLGVTLSRLNRPEEARTVLEESVALNRATGQRLLEAHALTGLGHVSRMLGRLDEAARSFEQSLELRRAAGDRVGEAWMWRRIAETHAARGDKRAAQHAADTAARLASASGDANLIAACVSPLPTT